MKELGILEGLLFVVGDDGLSISQICDVMDISETEAKNLLTLLQKNYEESDRGLKINYLGDAFKLTTKAENKEYYQKLIDNDSSNDISNAGLETLAVIAYNGPITRAEIDEIRGMGSSYIIRRLLAKDLIEVCGKADMPGKPNLYKVTNRFLDYLGLATIEDLPKIDDIIINNDGDLYSSIYKESVDN